MKKIRLTGAKKLFSILPKNSGRDVQGHVAMRHQGGRHKRMYREIDWLRTKDGMVGTVIAVEYDPNRTADVALIGYADGEKRYIIAPVGLKAGDNVVSGKEVDIKIGNTMPLAAIPIGTLVHNIEIQPGRGAQMIRSAGSFATVLAKDGDSIQIKLPSGEVRIFKSMCRATVGQISNVEWKNEIIGSAGRARHMGIRPTVRGVAQNPRSHPHGGGEGRSGIGMPSPKSPWGKPTLGKKTRKHKKYSNRFILSRKKQRS
jgi:large subunit ribosomal protein L2